MEPVEKSYYTIGEAAKLIGEAPSLIRFWEKEFTQLKPLKSEKGTRKYSNSDIELLKLIHHLVKEKGFTLDGAKQYLKKQDNLETQAKLMDKLTSLKSFLTELRDKL